MKKYLMTGVAAIALCAAFTSCSKSGEELYDPDAARGISTEQEIANVYNSYNQAFIKTFGQVNPNVDWGFGNPAKTRALNMAAGANKNRNLWAATDGSFKLLVPTPLSAEQRDRVRAYFQQNRYLTWEQPNMTDYFVQQVYTGGTNTTGSLSKETYTRGNGTSVTGGEHMDYLTIAGEHVLDFNAANNVNTATDVKDNNTLTNDDKYHSDQITLMIGITPTNVGFKASDGSVQHIDHMALVSAKTIDDWARKEENFVNGKAIGADVWYGKDKDGYDNSFWNRSFVGLDYEQQPASDAFATVAWNDPTPSYVKVDEIQPNYIWDSVAETILSKDQYKAQYGEYLLDQDGNRIPWLVSNTNEFLADPSNFPSQDSYMPRIEISTGNTQQVLDIQLIYAKVADNCYPVSTKQLQEWMKNVGGRDYYYSDWIVTLAPASEIEIPTTKKVRIMAEDLNAQAVDGDIEDSDWDFNDVVFDVEFDETGNGGTITLICAGGVLPLKVAGHEVHLEFDSSLTQDEKGWYPMINTGKGMGIDCQQKSFHIDNADPDNNGQGIKIEVEKTLSNGEKVWIELTARKGQPCSKFAVKPTVQPCLERDHIDFVSDHAFSRYVANGGELIW